MLLSDLNWIVDKKFTEAPSKVSGMQIYKALDFIELRAITNIDKEYSTGEVANILSDEDNLSDRDLLLDDAIEEDDLSSVIDFDYYPNTIGEMSIFHFKFVILSLEKSSLEFFGLLSLK